jgi:hypothetical protein
MDTIDLAHQEARDAAAAHIIGVLSGYTPEDQCKVLFVAFQEAIRTQSSQETDDSARELANLFLQKVTVVHGEYCDRCAPETQEVMQ